MITLKKLKKKQKFVKGRITLITYINENRQILGPLIKQKRAKNWLN